MALDEDKLARMSLPKAGRRKHKPQPDIMTQKGLLEVAQSMKERDAALLLCLYLTGARINEVVRQLVAEQVETYNIGDKKFLQFSNVITLKHREPYKRNILAPIWKERELIEPLVKYINGNFQDNPKGVLFPISSRRAYTILRHALGDTPMKACHYLRHCRNTHLNRLYKFDSFDLQKFNGWSSIAPAEKYVHLNVDDLAKKMEAG